jgi:hypothetical protein
VARDGVFVPEGVKLLEIDPRGRDASWTGIDDRGRKLAAACIKAIRLRRTRSRAGVGPSPMAAAVDE